MKRLILTLACAVALLTVPLHGATTPRSQVWLAKDANFQARLSSLLMLEAQVVITETTTISSASVANPSVVTFAGNHGLATGDVIVCANTNSTPILDGTAYYVTVTGATTLTIPVNVTVASTRGACTSAKHTGRRTFAQNILTAPASVAASVALAITNATNLTGANTTFDFENGITTTDATDAAIRSQIQSLWNALAGIQ